MRARSLLLALALALPAAGCVKKMALNSMADALSNTEGPSAFSQDDDLILVGESLPFALKTMESLSLQLPEHDGLKLALASGFAQYAAVYVLFPAEQLKYSDFDGYQAGLARARKLFARAQGYGMEGLNLRYPGLEAAIYADPAAALARTTAEDVPLLYWTGAAWLGRISISLEDMEAVGELSSAAALLQRANELDPAWDRGSVHDLLISVSPALPGPDGAKKAREHFDRAVALSEGVRASPYVSLATAVSAPSQDRAEFVSLLEKALAVDPAASPADTLANTYAQEKARFLLAHLDDIFVE